MRLATGVTDQYIYFVAIDSADHLARKTGLSSFTVYRSRNGGAATAYTTPTITEVSSGNMPGVYKFLIDEDMTIDSGDETQEFALHITATGMDPVTRVIELFRPPNDVGAAGASLTAIPWNASWDAEVQSEVADALAVYDPPTKAELDTAVSPLATSAALSTVAGYLDTEVAAILAAVDTEIGSLTTAVADLPTNAELATALGTADDAVLAQIALVKAKTDNLPSDPADASVIAGRFDTLDTSIADLPTNAELTTALAGADDAVLAAIAALNNLSAAQVNAEVDTAISDAALATAANLATVDTVVDAIKAKTDSLTFTVAGQVDANVQYVNDAAITGTGASGDEWGPA